jgi:hypothetical protein
MRDSRCPLTACPDSECGRYGCWSFRPRSINTDLTIRNFYPPPAPVGCICPPTSEQTCMSATCPRKPRTFIPKCC